MEHEGAMVAREGADMVGLLPADVLIKLWPAERIVSGMQVCKILLQASGLR